MATLQGSAATALLLCWLLAGCSQPRAWIDGTPAMTDLGTNASLGPREPTASPDKSESMETNTSSAPLPTEGLPSDSVASRPITSLMTEKASMLDSAGLRPAAADTPQTVWGILDLRGFPLGEQVAPNGVEYKPLFLLDLDFNIMLWRQQRLYLFADSFFWGQKAAPGITNSSQGAFDFSKREFDLDLGAAWNYAGSWEARVFAYSLNNLNRGSSQTSPSGFNDGVGLENRYYLGETYDHLGTAAFDLSQATFLSVGFYPTKTMVDANGNQFKVGPFARAYLTYDVWGEQYYLYGDVQFIAARSFQPMLLNWDVGLAGRPFPSVPRLEFRVGTQDMLNLQGGDLETTAYLAVRYIY
jgi:hypothetical protein